MLCIDKLKNNYHKPFEHIWCDLYCSFEEDGDVCINSFKRSEWQMYYTYYNSEYCFLYHYRINLQKAQGMAFRSYI